MKKNINKLYLTVGILCVLSCFVDLLYYYNTGCAGPYFHHDICGQSAAMYLLVSVPFLIILGTYLIIKSFSKKENENVERKYEE